MDMGNNECEWLNSPASELQLASQREGERGRLKFSVLVVGGGGAWKNTFLKTVLDFFENI